MASPGQPIRDEGLWGDIQAIIHIIGFCLRAVLRRRRVALIAAGSMLILGTAAAAFLPRTYMVSARLQANQAQLINTLATGKRPRPSYEDNPVEGVWERTHSREFLDQVIDESNLMERWAKGRGPAARLKDWVRSLISGELEGPLLRRALRNLLEERIQTKIRGEVIVFEVYWFDPDVTHDIGTVVVDEFLRMQQDLELNQIRDTLEIIETRITASSQRINETADRLEQLVQEKASDARKKVGEAAREKKKSRIMSFRRTVAPLELPAEAKSVQTELSAVRRQLARLEKDYKRDYDRAQDRLASVRDTLGPQHPDYREAVRELEIYSEPPDELRRLRDEEAALIAQLDKFEREARQQRSSDGGSAVIPEQRFDVVQVPMTGDVYAALVADPDVENLMSELRKYVEDHNSLLDRRDKTNLEFDTSKAAFNYRYIVTEPPVYPEGPDSPKVPLILAGALIGGIFFALGLSIVLDLLSRRILEPWQVEALLNVRVVGEIRRE